MTGCLWLGQTSEHDSEWIYLTDTNLLP